MSVTPRLLIAGLSGDSGKTIVSLSLLEALRARGLAPVPFKKGPDYIDAAWLGWAAGDVCRNLDSYMVDGDRLLSRFANASRDSDLALIEGNRGLFDGLDTQGTHSSASLARLLRAPVLLVVDATKATRTLAALVRGCMDFEEGVKVAGVVLNGVAGERHRKVTTGAIEDRCGIPVLGSLPKRRSHETIIPQRHLGLVPPTEADENDRTRMRLRELADRHLDVSKILKLAGRAAELPATESMDPVAAVADTRIGYFRDSVFTFYYPENLEALEAAGAELVPLSSLDDVELPEIDGLYIGGGFPETQIERLAENRSMMDSVARHIEAGLPTYAECGGLIYLCRTLHIGPERHDMAGVLGIDLTLQPRPCGHGYVEAEVEVNNPFFEAGVRIRGHEFHYTGLMNDAAADSACLRLRRGYGLGKTRDGLLYKNCFAAYMHLHADGVPGWAPAFLRLARRRKRAKLEQQPGRKSTEDGDCQRPRLTASL